MKILAPYFQNLVWIIILLCFCKANSQNPYQDGQWSDPIPFGIVPVAVSNLPNGKLLVWSSQFRDTFIGAGDGSTFFEIFDPFYGENGRAEGEFVANLNHDMFCPGINNLADGRILSAGGTSSEKTSIYDWQTGEWSVASPMNIPRGYQGNVTLWDGSVFTVGGSWSGGLVGNRNAERWSPETGWINLPGILGDDLFTDGDTLSDESGVYRTDNHAWLWAASNGKVFHAGPGSVMHWFDVSGQGSSTSVGIRGAVGFEDGYSMKGNTVMFDKDRILKVGGARSYDERHPAKTFAFVIDFSDENNIVQNAAGGIGLRLPRTMVNSTVLPNGQVLVTGGLDTSTLFSDIGAQLPAEIYDPVTNQFRLVASMQTPRTYHSVAILMADARVFVGGGGLCDGTNLDCVNHFDAEIYSPPYLFNPDGSLANRPSMDAPETADYNSTINVTGDTGINSFSLVRFSAATHSTNNEQRRIPVEFTGNGNYNVEIPDRNYLPPGYYMLFGMDTNGVPSMGEIIRIGNALPLADNPNLVLDMKFDEGAGSLAMDTSGNNNTGTAYYVDNFGANKVPSITNWGSGLFGGALETDGAEFTSNTIVEIPYSNSLEEIQDEVTIMGWVNRNEIVHNASVFTHDYDSMFFGFHNSLYKWEFRTTSGELLSLYAGYTPPTTWVHIAATYDGQTARLFANGVEVSSATGVGNLVLNPSEANYSSFTVSGFYDRRTNPSPNYNDSGVTDELDGRIDELKVFNKALGVEEISNYYKFGEETTNPEVAQCTGVTIPIEYKIGQAGEWTEGNSINALEGDEVFIRAKNYNDQYFITTSSINGPTLNSQDDLNAEGAYQIDTNVSNGDGFVDIGNEGRFVFTTALGCPSVIDLNIATICPPGSPGDYTVEYFVNNAWCGSGPGSLNCGESSITVEEGQRVILSTFPDQAQETEIILPNGNKAYIRAHHANGYVYEIGPISLSDQGTYVFTTPAGCQKTLEIIVNAADCSVLKNEYNNGQGWFSDVTDITVLEGSPLTLSILPNGTNYTISGPNGNNKGFNATDLYIPSITQADGGLYIFSTGPCEVTMNVIIGEPDCSAVETEYNINLGGYITGATEVTVTEGDELELSIIPNDQAFSVTGPNGNNKGFNIQDLIIPAISFADAGIYEFETISGCIVQLEVIVDAFDCSTVFTEYSVNNTGFIEGQANVQLTEGDNIQLSIVPNGIAFLIDGPNGNSKNYDFLDYTLSNVDINDAGLYTFVTGSNCIVELNVQIVASDCSVFRTEYKIDNGPFIEDATQVIIDEGSELTISLLPNNQDYSITGQNGNNKPLNSFDLIIDSITPQDEGIYTITSAAGCELTLEVLVTPVDCSTLETEYSIDNGANYVTGAGQVVVDEGGEIILSITPNDQAYSISGPNANNKAYDLQDLVLSNLTIDDQGLYTFTAGSSCNLTLELIINPSNTPPVAVASATPLSGDAPLLVTFTGSGSSDDTAVVSWEWDFADGSPVDANADTTHTFSTPGSYDVLLTVTDAEGLSDTATLTITVNEPVVNEAPVAVASATPLSGDAPLLVTFTGSGSSDDTAVVAWSWDFADGGPVDANADTTHTFSTPGTYDVVLTVTDAEGLSDTATLTITVNDPCDGATAPTLDPAGPFFTTDAVQTLLASPSGGSWGGASTDGTFDPSMGVGTYNVTYTTDNGSGCVQSVDINIIVNDPCDGATAPTLDPAGPFFTTDAVQTLSASPSGGSWGGASTDGTFDPSMGVGTYNVTYTTDNGSGCVQSVDIDITVNDPCDGATAPTLDPAGPFFTTDAVQTLSASPSGGSWGGASTDGTFDPSMGVGTYNVTYTTDNGSGCVQSVDINIIVNDPCDGATAPTLDPAGPFFTTDAVQTLSASPSGGSWGGASTDGTFDPSMGVGTYNVTYTTDNGSGCVQSVDIDITVNDPCEGTEVVNIDPIGTLTTDDDVQALSASPSGGTWGGASTDGTFDPSMGVGTYNVTYMVDFGNGCIKSDSITIEVVLPGDPCEGEAIPSIENAGPFFITDAVQTLSASPSGGSWGGASTDGTFDPSMGVGTYNVTYTTDNGSGCVQSVDINITVNDPCDGATAPTLDPAGPFFTTDAVQTLSASPSGGSWGGASTDGTFDPSMGVGTYNVTYTTDNGSGCVQSVDIDITVNDPCDGATAPTLDPAGPFFTTDAVQTLSASPSGGTWGGASTDGTFDPSIGVGTYNVTYTTDNGSGCVQSVDIDITVNDPCDGATAPTLDPAGPFFTTDAVQTLSASPSGGTWGGASTDGTFDPSIGVGTYNVTYTTDNGAGCVQSVDIDITVDDSMVNNPPVAVASATPLSGDAPLLVTFTGSGSSDDTAVVSWEWDFADGSPVDANADTTHTFSTPGSYDVVLTVTDAEGLSDTTTVAITVNEPVVNEPPVAVASATPLSGDAPLLVTFTGSGSIDDTAVVSWEWDFTDGSPIDANADTTHTFSTPGSYDVVLTVTDTEGLNDSSTLTIIVNEPVVNDPPVAVASATPLSGDAPLLVTFSGSLSTDDTAVISWAWDFADASPIDNNADTTHTFSTPGSYEVQLTVTDGEGLSDTTTLTITVNEPVVNEAPEAVAIATPLSGDAPLLVTFSGRLSTDDSGIVSYTWDFDDLATEVNPGSKSDTNSNTTHTFINPGTYEVTLTVTDEEGLTDSDTLIIQVNRAQCPPGSITAMYIADGILRQGDEVITVKDGGSLLLTTVQQDEFTITKPNGEIVQGNLNIKKVSISDEGTYVLTSLNGCTYRIKVNIDLNQNLSLENDINNIKFFPNPFSDNYISIDLRSFMNMEMAFSLFDIQGRLLMKDIIPRDHSSIITYSLPQLNDGIYYVIVENGQTGESIQRKVIKR